MRNFRKLEVWNLSMDLCTEVYQFTKSFPKEELYGLVSQIRRCSVSTPSNIAEGSSRDSEKDFARFLQIALGSAFELESQIEISMRNSFITKVQYGSTIEKLNIIQAKLNKFHSTVKNRLKTAYEQQ